MRMKKTATNTIYSAFIATALTACGGDGGATNTVDVAAQASTINLSGVAATGSALANATITLTDANGTVATKTADASGAYNFDVTALNAPLLLTASVQLGDTTLTLTSMVATKPAAGTTGTANVTPLTNAMAALLAPGGNPEELGTPAILKSSVTQAKLDDVSAKVKAAINNLLKDAGLDPAKFDPISTTFTADRKGADRVLELVRVEVTGRGVSLTNPAVVDDGAGSASVQITAATAVSAVAKLPAPPVNTVLGELDHLASLADTCFADAPAVRVTAKDAAGTPTASSPACFALPFVSAYKSGGLNSIQRYSGLLQSADLTGAKFSKPEKLYTTANGNAVFRMAYKTAAGAGGVLSDVAAKTNPVGKSYAWQIIGNQRDHDSAIDARLDNITQLNPATGLSESNKSQYRASIRLFFNPVNTAGLNVQMVRVKGPGLPAAGVVMNRSSVCGTNDYMTITSKTGSLLNSASKPIAFNSNTTNNFKLAGELKSGTFDWTKVGTQSSWRDTPMSDADLAAIPSHSDYTWEIWTFGAGRAYRSDITNTTAPDVTYTQRASSRVPSVGSLKSLPWNSLQASPFLAPTSLLATDQASAAIGWTTFAEPVDQALAFGQRNAAATATTPASFLRYSADTSATGVKISATTATVSPAEDPAGTASLAGVSGLTFTATNCAAAKFPVLDAVAGSRDATSSYGTYRDLTVRSRAYSLARKYVTNVWSTFID